MNSGSPSSKTFNIYPAIDILEGQCVRLNQGDFTHPTIYNADPVFVARRWKSFGAKFLHIIDLDGARQGMSINASLIRTIINSVDVPIQVGGGIRDYATAEEVLGFGATRIIIGSAILKDPEFAKKALQNFGDKIIVGMDCRKGKLAIQGWTENSEMLAIDKAKELVQFGLQRVIYTDIEKDGMLEGPNIVETLNFATETKVHTIVSGGISSIKDVQDIKVHAQKAHIDGVIIGKALYDNKIKPAELFNLKD